MALSKPIIAGLQGDSAEIIEKANCGILCEPSNVEQITEAFLKIYNIGENQRSQMAQNGLNYYREKMSFDSGVKSFNDLFEKITKKD